MAAIDGIAWDFAEIVNEAIPLDDPWQDGEEQDRWLVRHEVLDLWDALPEDERAWFIYDATIPYENIIDIDERGDEIFDGPHIYVTDYAPARGPFSEVRGTLNATRLGDSEGRRHNPDRDTRVQKFPTSYDIDQLKQKLRQRTGIPVPDDD